MPQPSFELEVDPAAARAAVACQSLAAQPHDVPVAAVAVLLWLGIVVGRLGSGRVVHGRGHCSVRVHCRDGKHR